MNSLSSLTHGRHHVAHKLMSRGLPSPTLRTLLLPAKDSYLKLGRGASVTRGERAFSVGPGRLGDLATNWCLPTGGCQDCAVPVPWINS